MADQERRWLWAILAIALVLRLAWAMTRPTSDAALASLPDQVEYLSLGRNLLHTGALSFHDPRFDQTVYAYRTPGYPAFIALCGGSPLITRAAQALIDTSMVLAVYLLTRRWLPGLPPLAAAAIVAANPLLIYFTGLVLSETLYTATLAWGLYLITLPRTWLTGIVLLVLGVLVRPAGIGLAVLLPPLAVWVNRKEPRAYLSQVFLRAAVAAAILLIALGLWSQRNQRVLGQRIWLTTNEGITRYDGFNPHANGSSNQEFVKEMPRLKDMDELQRNELFSQLAASYITAHPPRVLELAVRKIARTWSPIPLSEQFGSAKYVAIGLIYSTPFFLLALYGLWKGKLPKNIPLLLITPALYFTLVHAFSVGSLRYRVPVEPELAILAGSAVSLLLPWMTRSKQETASD